MDIGTAKIDLVITHHVGNKTRDEGIVLSNKTIKTIQEVSDTILATLLKPTLKLAKPYEFFHLTNINFNEAYTYSQSSFKDEQQFIEQSANLAKHLYSKSTNTSTPGGDLLFIRFSDIYIDNIPQRALGIFKIEKKEKLLSLASNGNEFDLYNSEVINPSGILKSAIITEGSQLVHAIEKGNEETKYWLEDFLKTHPVTTEKATTNFTVKLAKKAINAIEHVEKSTEYRTELANLAKQESLKPSDLYEINKRYLGEEKSESIFNEVISSVGFHPNQDDVIPSSQFKKQIKPIVGKYKIASGLEISISGEIEIESIKSLPSNDSKTFIIQIETKGK